MKDKSKRLTVVNTEKKPSEKKEVQQVIVQPSSSSSSHAPGFNPNLYLLKSVWDSVFEIKTDVSGQKYIFGKLPVVTKYGITMYADDGNVDIPQLAEGLPFDQRTIWFNPETKKIEVIGGTGGGGEGGVSIFWDLSGIPSWITNSKPIYNYSEIKNTPDLSVFVTGTALSETLADYATLSYLTGELKKYVTLDGAQDIKGVKNFVNGLKIGGLPITKKQDDVVYLDANLVVRGGITMYGDGEGGSSVPLYSTLGSLENVDKDAIDAVASVDRVLFQSAGSNVWSWKALSEIGGGSSGGSVSGNYLPLSGGTLTSPNVPLIINRTTNGSFSLVGFQGQSNDIGYLGFSSDGSFVVSPKRQDGNTTYYDVLHTGNYSSYALPLSGGKLSGDLSLTAGHGIVNPSTEYWIVGIDTDIAGTIIIGDPTKPTKIRGAYLNVGGHVYLTGVDSTSSTANTTQIVFGTPSDNHVCLSSNKNSLIINPISSSSEGQTVIGVNGHETYFTSSGKFIIGGSSGYGGHKMSVYGSIYTQSGIATDGNIIPVTNASREIGQWGNYFARCYTSTIYSGASDNNLWLVSGNNADETGITFARTPNGSNSVVEFAKINNLGLQFTLTAARIEAIREVQLRLKDSDNYSVVLGTGYFKPFTAANRNVALGRWDSQWKRIYIADNPSSTTASGLSFCDSSGKGLGTVGNSSGELGFYAVNELYLRPGCTSNPNGEVGSSGKGVVISTSGLTCSGGITMYSDIRKKTKLQDVELSLSQIANAPLIEHYYNSDQNKTTHVGSIAQYWAGLNDWFCKLDNEGFYTMEIQNCALASAISIARHLEKYESKTDKKIRMLKKRVQELEDKLERLDGGKYGCN